MSDRLIFHIDVNSAFLSWTSVQRLMKGESDLRLIPSVIGGDPTKRTSVVTAKSIPAKKYGIRTGEPVSSAIQKCPGLYIASSDFSWYHTCSERFIEICRKYAPKLEQFSIDECFLDMTGTHLIYPVIHSVSPSTSASETTSFLQKQHPILKSRTRFTRSTQRKFPRKCGPFRFPISSSSARLQQSFLRRTGSKPCRRDLAFRTHRKEGSCAVHPVCKRH